MQNVHKFAREVPYYVMNFIACYRAHYASYRDRKKQLPSRRGANYRLRDANYRLRAEY